MRRITNIEDAKDHILVAASMQPQVSLIQSCNHSTSSSSLSLLLCHLAQILQSQSLFAVCTSPQPHQTWDYTDILQYLWFFLITFSLLLALLPT